MTDCNDCMKDFEFFGDDPDDSAEFVIDSEKLANWAIKQIKAEIAEHDRIIEVAKEEIADINKQMEILDKRLESRTSFLKAKLYEYFQKVEHKATKTQETYKLLDGDLVWKKPTQKMVPDKEKLLAVIKASDMPEYIKVKEEVDWASYKKECTITNGKVINNQTGEVIECIAVEDVPGMFNIK